MPFFEEPTVEDPKDRLEVYDQVWIMHNNKPDQKMVYSRTEVMNYPKNGTEIEYRLVVGTCGASDSNAIRVDRAKIFKTREELVASI